MESGQHIVIVTIGTRGDMVPFLGLARELLARGHRVTIAAPEGLGGFCTDQGINFHSLGDDFETVLESEPAQRVVNGGAITKVRTLFNARSFANDIIETPLQRAYEVIKKADVVLWHPHAFFAREMAEAHNIPAFFTALQPLAVSGEFPLCIAPFPNLGRAGNRATYSVFRLQSFLFSKAMAAFRRTTLRSNPRSSLQHALLNGRAHVPSLIACSPAVCPRPEDWPEQVHLTGAWFPADRPDWKPSPRLQKFIQGGTKPVYIGFGSWPWNAKRNTKLIIEAVRQWGGRAVVAKGWGGIKNEDLPDTIHAINYAPHDRLFPLMAGLVHHGGAGTTQMGLRSGCPSFVAPVIVDGPFWGARVQALGAGPAPVALNKLDADTLAARLKDLVGNASFRTAAKNVSRQIASEDGLSRAVSIIEGALGRQSSLPQLAN